MATVIENASSNIRPLTEGLLPNFHHETANVKNTLRIQGNGRAADSSTAIREVSLLAPSEADMIRNTSGNERLFWMNTYAKVRNYQDSQRKCLNTIHSLRAQLQASKEYDWTMSSFRKATQEINKEKENLRSLAKELEKINEAISSYNAQIRRDSLFGQVQRLPYLKPILCRPDDYQVIEANPSLLNAVLFELMAGRELQSYRQDLLSSGFWTLNLEEEIRESLEDINIALAAIPQVEEELQKDDEKRGERNRAELEREKIHDEDLLLLEFTPKRLKQEKRSQEFRQELKLRRVKVNERIEAWKKMTGIEDYHEPLPDFLEFCSVYVPDQGDNLNLDDEDLEPPDREIINEYTDVDMDAPHIEYECKYTRGDMPSTILKCVDKLGGAGGPLQRFIFSVVNLPPHQITADLGDQQARKEIDTLVNIIFQECDKEGIDRAEWALTQAHIITFVGIVQQAFAAYQKLKREPNNSSFQTEYSTIRQQAGIWLGNNKFPESFLDALVPPESLIQQDVANGAESGALGQDPLSAPKPTDSGLLDEGSKDGVTSIPEDDSEDQCAPLWEVECPPMTVYEDGVFKKVVNVVKLGFMTYGLLKWPGSNSKYPNLFQHELVPKGRLRGAVEEFIKAHPEKEFEVANKPTKTMKWQTARIGGSASVRRDPEKEYKTYAVTYDWVKFEGFPLQRFRRSDLIKRYGRKQVMDKINDYLEKAGQKPPVPPTKLVFIKEQQNRRKNTIRKADLEEEGESLHGDDHSEEDADSEENVSNLIDDAFELDIEETKRKNQEKYAQDLNKQMQEIQEKLKTWEESQKKAKDKSL